MQAIFSRILNLKLALILATLASLFMLQRAAWAASTPAATSSNSKIIKWVDDKGITHYGDNLPAQYSGRDNSVINNQGVLLQHNQAAQPLPAKPDKLDVEQQRRDHALLATYVTEQEINLARDRNILVDQAELQNLQDEMFAAKAQLALNKKNEQSFIARKKEVPTDLSKELQKNQIRIIRIDAQITQRKTSIDSTRQRFDNEKRRFNELQSSNQKPEANSAPINSAPKAAATR